MDPEIQIEEIVQEYSEMLYRLAFARTGNSHDSEDIVQEVFLKLMRSGKIGSFYNSEHLKAWLIRVAVNTGKNFVKTAAKRHEVGEIDRSIDHSSEASESGIARFGEEDENLARLETKSVVYPLVQSLPEKYRTIIHLFYYEDMKVSEIAKAAGLGVSTVKSRLHRARNLLKEKLDEAGFNYEE